WSASTRVIASSRAASLSWSTTSVMGTRWRAADTASYTSGTRKPPPPRIVKRMEPRYRATARDPRSHRGGARRTTADVAAPHPGRAAPRRALDLAGWGHHDGPVRRAPLGHGVLRHRVHGFPAPAR